MDRTGADKRKETRYPIDAEATVQSAKNGGTIRATTENLSERGVLLHFKDPIQLAIGDEVTCEFSAIHDADQALPCWGVGRVIRVDGHRVDGHHAAIEFSAAGFHPVAAKPQEAA
jgi:hypothetical protein